MAGNTLTREQTSRTALEASPDEQLSDEWEPTPFTAAPPPLPDMEQRWVRIRLHGQDDVQNYLRARHNGWTPRPAETVSGGHVVLLDKLSERFGEKGSVVQNQDCILMHRPVSMGNKVRAHHSAQSNRLVQSVKQFVSEHLPAQRGAHGAVEELSMTSTVGNGGRRPTIPD